MTDIIRVVFCFFSACEQRGGASEVGLLPLYYQVGPQGLRTGLPPRLTRCKLTTPTFGLFPLCFLCLLTGGIRWTPPLKAGALLAPRERLHFGVTTGRWRETISTDTGEHVAPRRQRLFFETHFAACSPPGARLQQLSREMHSGIYAAVPQTKRPSARRPLNRVHTCIYACATRPKYLLNWSACA